jgi:hypothetical protein
MRRAYPAHGIWQDTRLRAPIRRPRLRRPVETCTPLLVRPMLAHGSVKSQESPGGEDLPPHSSAYSLPLLFFTMTNRFVSPAPPHTHFSGFPLGTPQRVDSPSLSNTPRLPGKPYFSPNTSVQRPSRSRFILSLDISIMRCIIELYENYYAVDIPNF